MTHLCGLNPYKISVAWLMWKSQYYKKEHIEWIVFFSWLTWEKYLVIARFWITGNSLPFQSQAFFTSFASPPAAFKGLQLNLLRNVSSHSQEAANPSCTADATEACPWNPVFWALLEKRITLTLRFQTPQLPSPPFGMTAAFCRLVCQVNQVFEVKCPQVCWLFFS